jgi:hypothetical protein
MIVETRVVRASIEFITNAIRRAIVVLKVAWISMILIGDLVLRVVAFLNLKLLIKVFFILFCILFADLTAKAVTSFKMAFYLVIAISIIELVVVFYVTSIK